MTSIARVHLGCSKSQYETQFKKWGLRKNHKREDWKAVARSIQRREKLGNKKTEVFLDGRSVSNAKLHGEIKRHGCLPREGNAHSGISPMFLKEHAERLLEILVSNFE